LKSPIEKRIEVIVMAAGISNSSTQSADPGQANQHRYHFSLMGHVKEIIFQNKAIVYFKLNGKEERAVLLAKVFAVNGKPLEEILEKRPTQTLTDYIKLNEAIQFDCHIYDKVAPGSGKDKCNFFIMKACKYGDIWPNTMSTTANLIPAPPSRSGTGWVSEISDLYGVLTYNYNGVDQRVSFHANRMFLFKKRLALSNSLTQLLHLGEHLEFEAVPSEVGSNINSLVVWSFCPMSATLVWRGKKPSVDAQRLESPTTSAGENASSGSNVRKDSLDNASTSSSETNEEMIANSSGGAQYLILPSTGKPAEVFRGIGMIAKVVSDSIGIIWWLRKPNHYKSVWFHRQKTFKYGLNLHDKSLREYVKEGDAVTIIVEKASSYETDNLTAIQVLITDEAVMELDNLIKSP
jgi:hypothetical protein